MIVKQNSIAVQPYVRESTEILARLSLSDWSGSLTTFKGFTGVQPVDELNNVSWQDIAQRICPQKPTLIVDKKQGEYFVPCLLKEAPLVANTLEIAQKSGLATVGKMRSKSHVTSAAFLVMDIDGIPESDFNAGMEKIKQDGLTYLGFSTFSYGNPAKPGMRARIIMPVDRALDIDDYAAAWHGFDQYYWNGQAGKADSSGANLYQQQGVWCCDPSRQGQAFKLSNEAGVASVDELINMRRSAQNLLTSTKQNVPLEKSFSDTNGEYPISDANRVADNCNQIGLFRETKGDGQTEPLWTDCLGVVGHCENGLEFSHLWSDGHARYNQAETTRKLESRLKYPPTTCVQFRKTNPEGCRDCGQQCHSPITLGWQPTIQSKNTEDKNAKSNSAVKSDHTLFEDVVPHPDPVDPSKLMVTISALIRRFIVIDAEQADAVALWIVLTWLVDHVEVLPLLIINAPEKACGKSQLLDVVGRLSARPLPVSNITTAGLFRAIDLWKPTILIDEADTFIREKQELKGLINAGHIRSNAYVLRIVGDTHEPKRFNVWGAKALAGIALDRHLSDATMSRAVSINMRRKMPHESVERIRHADRYHFTELKSKLARFADDYAQQISQARPTLPDELSDRAQDNWEPLLAIAECSGDEWGQRARAAAIKLSNESESSVSIGNELLADIKHIFESKKIEKISSAELIAALSEDEEMPWATFNRGKAISPRQLAGLLSKYGIRSKTVRMPFGTPKGYDIGQFQDVFARYLTPAIETTPQPENLPQRRNVSPQSMPAMASRVADDQQHDRNGNLHIETLQSGDCNTADTPEPSPVVTCGGVADVAADSDVSQAKSDF